MYQQVKILIGKKPFPGIEKTEKFDKFIEISDSHGFTDYRKIDEIYNKLTKKLENEGKKLFFTRGCVGMLGDIIYHYKDSTVALCTHCTGYRWEDLDQISLNIVTQNLGDLVSDLLGSLNLQAESS